MMATFLIECAQVIGHTLLVMALCVPVAFGCAVLSAGLMMEPPDYGERERRRREYERDPSREALAPEISEPRTSLQFQGKIGRPLGTTHGGLGADVQIPVEQGGVGVISLGEESLPKPTADARLEAQIHERARIGNAEARQALIKLLIVPAIALVALLALFGWMISARLRPTTKTPAGPVVEIITAHGTKTISEPDRNHSRREANAGGSGTFSQQSTR